MYLEEGKYCQFIIGMGLENIFINTVIAITYICTEVIIVFVGILVNYHDSHHLHVINIIVIVIYCY